MSDALALVLAAHPAALGVGWLLPDSRVRVQQTLAWLYHTCMIYLARRR